MKSLQHILKRKNISKCLVSIFSSALLLVFFVHCEDGSHEGNKYMPPKIRPVTHKNDTYLYDNNGKSMLEKYGIRIKWKWDNKILADNVKASPIDEDLVIPVTKVIEYLWAGTFESVGKQGTKLIRNVRPVIINFIGSKVFFPGGKDIVGLAHGGVSITMMELNSYNLVGGGWVYEFTYTFHHEYAHTIDQNKGLPVGFNSISKGYVGEAWRIMSVNQAISAGMVTPYAMANEHEDFAETIAKYLLSKNFENEFLIDEKCDSSIGTDEDIQQCINKNKGRKLIAKKLQLVLDFYQTKFGIDLKQVRDSLNNRLNYISKHKKIPNG